MSTIQQTGSRDERVLAERVRIVLGYWSYQILGQLIAGTILLIVVGLRSEEGYLGWYVVLIVMGCATAVIPRLVRSKSSREAANWIVGSNFLMALCWAYCSVFLFPNSIVLQLLLLLLQAGLLNGAFMTNALPRQFYVFFLTTMSPLIVMFALQETALHLAVAGSLVVYSAMVMTIGRAFPKTIGGLIGLQLDNADLLEQVSAQKAEAEEANKAKSQFLAAASHDLRQPLHALTLFTTVLEEKTNDPETAPIIKNIRSSSSALEGLLNALLDISKLDAGTLQTNIAAVDVDDIVARLCREFQGDAAAQGLSLTHETCGLAVESDGALLENILRNLISNAIRYTQTGGVSVAFERVADTLSIQVLDTGIGVPPDKVKDVFREFYQLGNAERDRNKGLGLGLAIVARIAELLGHSVAVSARSEGGSCFSVTVGISEVCTTAAVHELQLRSPGGDLAGINVLVVDDEQAIREGMQTLLESWGCVVRVAADSGETLDAVLGSQPTPDVMIVDYRLRDCLGTELVEKVRAAIGVRTPALIVTGDTGVQELKQVGSSGYPMLHKPVQPARLRAFLHNVARGGSGD